MKKMCEQVPPEDEPFWVEPGEGEVSEEEEW